MITIAGLTPKQKTIMDIMWTMETITQVEAFIKSLPRDDAIDAHGLLQIAIVETLEEEGRMDEYEDMALDVIANARRP